MKPFDLDDVFLMSEILDKTGLIVDLKKITDSIKTDKLETAKDAKQLGKEMLIAVGVDIIAALVKSMHKAKNEVKRLIANLTGKSLDEVGRMNLKEIQSFFADLLKQEGFADFFKQAAGSIE